MIICYIQICVIKGLHCIFYSNIKKKKSCTLGWGGRGLGAKEQRIVDPIEASDVRDKQDQFKGVGVSMF